MKNKIAFVLITIFCCTVIAPIRAREMVAPSPLSSAFAFPAGYASHNIRAGYRKFDGVDGYDPVEREPFFIYGGAAGIRIPLKKYPRLRFQPVIEVGWGTAEEQIYRDALVYNDGRTADAYERMKFFTYGTQADAHLLFPTYDINRTLYLSAGVGLHINTFYDTWETKSGTEVMKTNEMNTVSGSLNIGGGVEYRINRQRAVALGYNLRFWSPVMYTDYGDMFPMGVKYTEYFYSHMLQIHILLPRSRALGFR